MVPCEKLICGYYPNTFTLGILLLKIIKLILHGMSFPKTCPRGKAEPGLGTELWGLCLASNPSSAFLVFSHFIENDSETLLLLNSNSNHKHPSVPEWRWREADHALASFILIWSKWTIDLSSRWVLKPHTDWWITVWSLYIVLRLYFSGTETIPSHWVFDLGNPQRILRWTWRVVFILTFNLDVISYGVLPTQGFACFLKQ